MNKFLLSVIIFLSIIFSLAVGYMMLFFVALTGHPDYVLHSMIATALLIAQICVIKLWNFPKNKGKKIIYKNNEKDIENSKK